MSILPLSSFGRLAISFYELDINVRDYRYVTVNGFDQRELYAERTIRGAYDPTNTKEMERIFGGSIGQGSIMIYTNDPLYIYDATLITEFNAANFNFANDNSPWAGGDNSAPDVNQNTFGQDNQNFGISPWNYVAPLEQDTIGPTGQSYILYDNDVYRVSAKGPWQSHIGIRVYLCKLFLNQDGQ